MCEVKDKQKQVLLDIKSVADRLKLSIMLVGAGARILVFDNKFKIPGRGTVDLDFAIQISNWLDFQAFSRAMTEGFNPLFKLTRVSHKFIHISTDTEVDIVPFGAIGQPNQQIQWSDGNQMNILGLDEAYLTAEAKKIEEVEFKVINISAFLVLKVFAWNDRKAKKDLEDIYFILDKYSDDDRVFDELIDELSQEVIQYEQAPAFLLGRDIKNTFSQNVINEFKKVIENILDRQDSLFSQLVSSTFNSDEWDEKFNMVVAKFEALYKGILLVDPPNPP